MITTEKNIESAVGYYTAMKAKDLPRIAQYLHPDVVFTGPLAEVKGKETLLESIKGLMSSFNTLSIRAKFGHDNQVMLAWDLDCGEPIGVLKSATLMTFQDGLISRLELFYDARPFEKK